MSCDLVVFDLQTTPLEPKEFLAWLEQQTSWEESHGYDNPQGCTRELLAWFLEMRSKFEWLKYQSLENPYTTDYSFAKDMIYASFAGSMAREALQNAVTLASKHRVGVFEVSTQNAELILPLPEN